MRLGRFLLAGLSLIAAASAAQAGVRVGIGIGIGIPIYRPYGYYGPYPYGYPYPYPYPYYGAPPVVVAAPPPVVVGAAPAVPAPPPAPMPPPPPPADTGAAALPPLTPIARGAQPDSAPDMSDLNDPSPQARAQACIRLGRSKDARAVSPLSRTLKDDSSPVVREAAARGLGLIGSPLSLAALQFAAQSDDDRDVRRSASFAAEVIRANLRR